MDLDLKLLIFLVHNVHLRGAHRAPVIAVETSSVMVKVMAHLDKCRNEAYLVYPRTFRVTLLNNVTSLVRWRYLGLTCFRQFSI